MSRPKVFASLLLVTGMLLLQFGSVLAAPVAQVSEPLVGTVQSITLDTSTSPTTVLVTLKDSSGAIQSVRLSVDDAVTLGLVTLDPNTGEPVVNTSAIGSTVSIDPGIIIPDQEQKQHPVASALAAFFSDLTGIDYDTIMQYHEDGTGFGVIAQALWMTKALDGDSQTFSAILDAKRSGDYSAITLPDGSTPTNWGQFMKALLSGDRKQNLGMIMSGRADGTQEHPGGPGNGHGNGLGRGHNKDHGPKR